VSNLGYPAPFPDELAYSVIARYLRDWGYQSRKQLLSELMKNSQRQIAIEWPIDLVGMAKSFSASRSMTPTYLAQHHTLLPYFACFEPLEARRKIVARVNDPNGSQIFSIRTRNNGTSSALKFCTECLDEDTALHGMTYWHRAHQLPGIVACEKHGILLYRSTVPRMPTDPTMYLAPHRSRCISAKIYQERWIVSRDISIRIADRSIALLQKRLGRPAHISIEGYRRIAMDAGYIVSKTRIDTKRLDADFRHFLKLRPTINHLRPWWHGAIRNLDIHLSPLQHILFRLFLNERLNSATLGNVFSSQCII